MQQTLSILKPDSIKKSSIGKIISYFEKENLHVVAAKMVHLSESQAQGFYAVHKERPFYGELVDFMTSGPVLILVLEGENAIEKNRKIMGNTDPKKASPGTIRGDFANSIDQNAVHGSDSPETAKTEIEFFFKNDEIFSR